MKHSPNTAATAPGRPAHLGAGEHGHVDLIGAGQDAAHRHGGQELLLAQPLLLDHQHLPRPRRQPAAERGQRDVVERQRQLAAATSPVAAVRPSRSLMDQVVVVREVVLDVLRRVAADPAARSGARTPSRSRRPPAAVRRPPAVVDGDAEFAAQIESAAVDVHRTRPARARRRRSAVSRAPAGSSACAPSRRTGAACAARRRCRGCPIR